MESTGKDANVVNSKEYDDLLDCSAFGGGGCPSGPGGGQMVDGGGDMKNEQGSNSAIHAYPRVSWLEFTEWLERGLDDCGLEPALYARCVLSILKQPPEPVADTSVEQAEAKAKFLTAVYSNHNSKNNSAPSSRKNSFGSLAMALEPEGAMAVLDTRKEALLDCLGTMHGDKVELEKFVDDIMQRYMSMFKHGGFGEKQNDSVDSGVCPSPEESFQNYDEAFPPLGQSSHGSNSNVFSELAAVYPRGASALSSNGKRPAEINVNLESAMDGDMETGVDASAALMVDDAETGAPAGDGGSPIKRLKLNSTSAGSRSLRSCPDFNLSSSVNSGNGAYTEKRATFCCPVVRTHHVVPTAIGACKQPQFIIPKCWTVGSWPSRYDRSTKPVGDVPFWSCSEWFCTIHKRLEFGLLNAKINGDKNSLAALNVSGGKTAPPGGSDPVTSVTDMEGGTGDADGYFDVEIFEIEPAAPVLPQQPRQQSDLNSRLGSGLGQNVMEQTNQTVPEMFDAPRFILHIINEDDAVADRETLAIKKQLASGVTVGNKETTAPGSYDWTPFLEVGDEKLLISGQTQNCFQFDQSMGIDWAAYSKFSFDALDGDDGLVVGSQTTCPIDMSGLASFDIGFCMPKCSQLSAVAQRHQQLIAPVATSGGQQGNTKQKLQSLAVPIKESTHFIPIRSESMEDAYILKPGFDDVSCAMEEMDGYYIYHHDDSEGLTVTNKPSAPSAPNASATSGRTRRAFTVRFRASNPDKMCQTEDEPNAIQSFQSVSLKSIHCGNEDLLALMEKQWYSQEFEIWSHQNATDDGRVEKASRWMEGRCGNLTDMIFNDFYPPDGDRWLNETESGDGEKQHIEGEVPAAASAEMGDRTSDGQQQLEIWQKEDERYEDSLLHYVSSISLISPLDVQTTTV